MDGQLARQDRTVFKSDASVTEVNSSDELNRFSTDKVRADLKRHSIRGGLTTLGSQGILFLLQATQIVVLSRLLSPSDFGLFAMVTAVTGFAMTFKDGGLSMATIQRAEITHAQISSLFWINVLIGLCLAAIVASLAPVVAWFFGEPRLVGLTFAIAFTFVLAGTTIQHQALIRREMRFGTLAAIQVVSLTLAVVAAIVAARLGAEYWALAVIPVVQSLTESITTWICSGWVPGPFRRGTGIRSMLTFGGNLTLASSINYIGSNFDKVVVGVVLGPTLLGLYERAYRLVTLPLSQINGPISAVAIPSLSRIVEQTERYRAAYLETIQKIMVIVGVGIAFAIACSDWLVILTLGKQWEESASIFSIIAVGALLLPVWNSTGWLFITQGRMKEHLAFHLIDTPLKIGFTLLGIQWGLVGVCLSVAVRYYLTIPILFWFVGRHGPVRARDFYRAMALPTWVIASVLATVHLYRYFLPHLTPVSFALPMGMAVSVAAAIGSLIALPSGRRFLRSLRQNLNEILARKKSSIHA
ncbi:lipopolysaccharide biosynthesis protein [Planctomicrobium sp. SH527]|uniref:lipopolysaccharide biosynthesis protein n=1 Tax=Planctomicrobium sp. SH527 TaxID=3448123 RepID=UPI003F5BC62B